MALADIALAVGQNREALIAAVDAIRLYQLDPRSDQLAVRAALGMPDLAEARKLLQLALEAKDSVALRIGMAQIALALRDLPEVRAQAQRALQLDPNNVEARRLLQASGG
jgi:tetratricopeptide (TPR) repeat protein